MVSTVVARGNGNDGCNDGDDGLSLLFNSLDHDDEDDNGTTGADGDTTAAAGAGVAGAATDDVSAGTTSLADLVSAIINLPIIGITIIATHK